MRATVFGFVIAVVASLSPRAVDAEIDGDAFVSRDWGVSLRAPSHWQMSERTSYPNIILSMSHQQPAGRMLLSVEVQPKAIDAKTYAQDTAKVLTKLGFFVRAPQRHPGTGAWYFDFDNCIDPGAGPENANTADCAGKVFMRQGFLVEGKIGYALTLAASDVYARGRLLRSWDLALKSMKIDRVSTDPVPPPGTGPATGPAAAEPNPAQPGAEGQP